MDLEGDLTGDGDDGDRVHVRIGDRRDQVGRTRTARSHAHADLAAGRRVALRRVSRALLVAHEDVPHLGGVQQRIVCRQDCTTGDPEDGVDAQRLQRHDQSLRAGDLGCGLAGGHGACAGRTRKIRRRGTLLPGRVWGRVGPGGLDFSHFRHRFQELASLAVLWSEPVRDDEPSAQKNPPIRMRT